MYRLYLGLIIMLLAGCTQTGSENSTGVSYHCGLQPLTASFSQNQMVLSMRGGQQQLQQLPAASGSKYQNEDGTTVFWSKGREAQVTWRGEQLPLCTEDGYLPNDVAFRGNEPFWLLTVNGQQATLTTPEDEQQLSLTDERQKADSKASDGNHWRVETTAGHQLEVIDNICYDSMSGIAYPYQVTLLHLDKQLNGCGGQTEQLIQGKPLQVKSMSGYSASTAQNAELQFLPDGRLTGSDGCNRIFGHYSLKGEMARLNIAGSTKRMCSDKAMAFAQSFTELLNNIIKIDIKEEDIVIKAQQGQHLTLSSQ
ncbi:MAG: META domain-containing protein [Pseudomonadota bacterium]